MSDIKSLFKQSSHYFIGNIAIAMAGFISFPILTRMLSVSDYGLLGLMSVTILIGQSLGKMGAVSATVRFFQALKNDNKLNSLYASLFFGYTPISLLVAFGVYLLPIAIPNIFSQNLRHLLSICSLLILFGCLLSFMTSILRAQQKTALYNIVLVTQRYLMIAFGIIFLLILGRTVDVYYIGQIVAEGSICLLCWTILFRKTKVNIKSFSPKLFSKLVKFGLPLSLSELSHLALSYFDRYLIHWFLGASALGVYAAGYNLTTYVTDIIMYPINYALDPIYMRIYSNRGVEEVAKFLGEALRYFCLIIFPIAFGFIAISGVLINILATEKYSEAVSIMPFVIAGNSIYASQVILNAGLFINRKTQVLMKVKILSCILNIALNLLLIEKAGIIGAALSTFISYTFYTLLIMSLSFKEIKIPILIKPIAIYFISANIMYYLVTNISLEISIGILIYKIIIGALVYCFLVLLLDKELRYNFFYFIKKNHYNV